MAQIKRLTRAQKIVLSDIRNGRQPKRTDSPVILQELESRGLIELTAAGWVAVQQEEGEQVDG